MLFLPDCLRHLLTHQATALQDLFDSRAPLSGTLVRNSTTRYQLEASSSCHSILTKCAKCVSLSFQQTHGYPEKSGYTVS